MCTAEWLFIESTDLLLFSDHHRNAAIFINSKFATIVIFACMHLEVKVLIMFLPCVLAFVTF